MGSPFEVDHATLHTAAKDVRATGQEVSDDLGKLWNVVDDLAIAWQGQASACFQRLMHRWNDDSKALLSALSDIADLLDKSATTHQANDEQQDQMISKYHNILNQ